MSDMFLTASSSPHVRSKEDVSIIMRDVVIALLPAFICSIYFFGMKALTLTLVAVLVAVGTEALIQKLMKKPITINDWSAVVTGVLLAFNLPAGAPWWIALIGSVFAIAIVKHAFGGIGQNFMNPALAARAFLLASWPTRMTAAAFTWPGGADAVATATPLELLKGAEGVVGELPSIASLFMGNVAGTIGETSALALIIGGAYLLYRKVITWRIPTIYIGTVAVLTFIFGQDGLFTGNVLYHLFAGGLMLGAFYMATDYSSSPVTPRGQIIYALGCGIITSAIRLWGGYPEGVSYSILLMNVAAPLIDKYTMPKIYGEVKANA
ncbi:RnfABCDGE type electron transport complex subunit D [Irregularibacter muris]|uniref:Ion-translocating oxidoreductase complex subunit D n=1 Tax=Irregularibacter muris TaxID=1796619 RepID=A0AAE3HFX0_9FIRM|nr:RnfABCDGE type electron transport complex subunit D [Irregularibacter muris]MCR1899890.1 RnfABCDGE type electron transport complex subunit D [Irregularibacter muris]